jgi:toluene monooxygenase system protein E
MFQAGHEMRRIQRLTYRMVQLRSVRDGFGSNAKALWREDPAWQPLRRLIERLLVTYDAGEAITALNLCVKPSFDRLFLSRLAGEAVRRGDPLFAEILVSFAEDSAWQREWTRALVEVLVRDRAENQAAIDAWTSKWAPEVEAALEPFSFLFGAAV